MAGCADAQRPIWSAVRTKANATTQKPPIPTLRTIRKTFGATLAAMRSGIGIIEALSPHIRHTRLSQAETQGPAPTHRTGARLKASTELMSAWGAPARTSTSITEWKRFVRVLGTILLSLISTSMRGGAVI